MPPHPQHSIDEVLPMIDWILSLAHDETAAPNIGAVGYFQPRLPSGVESGVWTLTKSYTDLGAPEAARIRGEAQVRLHSRRKRAPHFDRWNRVEWVDVFERGIGWAGAFRNQSWISWDEIDLSTIDRVRVNVTALDAQSVRVELRLDAPDGDLIGHAIIEPRPDALGAAYSTQDISIKATNGLHDLYVIALVDVDPTVTADDLSSETGRRFDGQVCLSLNWREFL